MIVIIQNDGSQAQLTKGDAGRSCSGRGLEVEALGQVKVEALGAGEGGGLWGQAVALQAFPGVNSKLSWVGLCIHLVTTGGTRALIHEEDD